MATPTHKLLQDYAKHLQRVNDLKKLLLLPEARKFYPPMNDDDWIKFCNTYPVEKTEEKKKKKPAKKKAKVREEVD